jgi:hypothetical protein
MDALYPWPELHAQLGEADTEKTLVVQKSPTIGDLELIFNRAREEKRPFTHVHILAHGQLIRDPQDPARYYWGLDLRGVRPVEPEELANAIGANDGLPAAVMVAVCDSANQTSPFDPGKSFAQELHRSGIPVVVASQLPLTQVGSVTLSRAFYPPLLRGGDVRSAIDAARSGLYRDPETGYDWMSLVAYVQLPEGYADLTLQAALQSELGLLEVAGHWTEERLQRADSPSPQDIDRLAVRLSECIETLRRRKEQMDSAGAPSPAWDENQGLLGSAHKRLAQLLFDRYRRTADAAVLLESHRLLNEAMGHYRTAHETNLMNHWAGVQRLSLEAALFSRIDPDDWIVVRKVAEKDARNSNRIWALGSLAELSLLAPLAGRERQLGAAKEALVNMRASPAALAGNPSPIDSTRRQLRRYMAWWTKANGFFASCSGDLAADAEELVMSLE